MGPSPCFHHRKKPSSDRFLLVFSDSQLETSSFSSTIGDELNEEDIFWITGCATVANLQSTSASSSSSSPSSSNSFSTSSTSTANHSRNQLKNCGILAALPETESACFNHKASVCSSSSSDKSIRTIPCAPRRPPLNRQNSMLRFQSAPVDVPVLSEAMRRSRRAGGFDDVSDDAELEDKDGGLMLPPHEIVAAKQTPAVACSVLEGIGRTLRGRDLKQVRNAVWRSTGFLD